LASLDISKQVGATICSIVPGVGKRLATGGLGEWSRLFSELATDVEGNRSFPRLRRADLQPLVLNAVKGASTSEVLLEVLQKIQYLRLAVPVMILCDLIEDRGTPIAIRRAALEILGDSASSSDLDRLVACLRASDDIAKPFVLHAICTLGAVSESTLRSQLGSPDVACKAIALEHVPNTTHPEFLRALCEGATDSRVIIRRASLRAIARLRTPELIAALRTKLVATKSDEAAALTVALANAGSNDWLEDGKRLLKETNPDTIIEVLCAIRTARLSGLFHDVLPLLGSSTARVRVGALKCLLALREPGANAAIEVALKDKDRAVVLLALRSIPKTLSEEGRSLVRQHLNHPDLIVKSHAIESLGFIRDGKAQQDIAQLLLHEAPEVRSSSLIALSAIGADLPSERIAAALTDRAAPVRMAGIRYIQTREARVVLPILGSLLEKSEGEVRASLVNARVFFENGRVEVILSALKDPSRNVRRAAAQAAEMYLSPAHMSDLLPLLDDPDYTVRASIVRAIATLGGQSCLETLRSTRHDKHYLVRWYVYSSLCRLGELNAVEDVLESCRIYDTALSALNALRNEERYGLLSRIRISIPTPSTFRDCWEHVASHLRLTAVISPELLEMSGDAVLPPNYPISTECTLVELIELLEIQAPHSEWIIQGNELLIMSRREALASWTGWLDSRRKGK
jgi:HEAT repeat protein